MVHTEHAADAPKPTRPFGGRHVPMTRDEIDAEMAALRVRVMTRRNREDEQRADWARQGVKRTGYSDTTEMLIGRLAYLEQALAAMPASEADVAHALAEREGGC